MINPISNRSNIDYQLVSVAIDLVHKVLAILDCNPDLSSNRHIVIATNMANKWNELFIDNIINTQEGSQL